MNTSSATRDIVVVGSSAGGVVALPRLLAPIPQDLPAAILVVQHQGDRESQLVHILQNATSMPVGWAEQGDRIERGRVYVAPPGLHMLIADGHITLSGGPREHYSRPSIDRLFRSAAARYGARTIAVLLTGLLDDGVLGAIAVHIARGRVVVQDPEDAEFPELPQRALAAFAPDAVLPVDAVGRAIIDLVAERVPAPDEPVRDVALEAALDSVEFASQRDMDRAGRQTTLTCPDCGGPLWQLGGPPARHWRCSLGHSVGSDAMLAKNREQVEAALWSAVRALHERATTFDALARDAAELGNVFAGREYHARAKDAYEQAEVARRFMAQLLEER